jgi:nucleotide-binding universal stress UspA family protein
MDLIVVGVDRSEGAKAALAFAHEEALLRGATLRAVHAWQFGYNSFTGFVGYSGFEGAVPAVGGGDISSPREAAAAALDATVRETLPSPGDVKIEQRVVEGTAGAVLVDESRNADLLVVGSRGHGGFAQLLLGSVSQQCAHHAACPVVIIRSKSAD